MTGRHSADEPPPGHISGRCVYGHPVPMPPIWGAPAPTPAEWQAQQLHQHLDQVLGQVNHHITTEVRRIMSAIESLTAQVDNLKGTVEGTVVPALNELADLASNPDGGVSDENIQAAADQLSTIASNLASATQDALNRARNGDSTPPQEPPQPVV